MQNRYNFTTGDNLSYDLLKSFSRSIDTIATFVTNNSDSLTQSAAWIDANKIARYPQEKVDLSIADPQYYVYLTTCTFDMLRIFQISASNILSSMLS